MTGAEELLKALRRSIAESLSGEPAVALSYSGGLDSSVAGRLASERSRVRAYSCVTEGSFDEKNIEDCARLEHLDLAVVRVDSGDIRGLVRRVASVLGSDDPVPVAYTIPIVCVVDACQERTVVLGSGADELFGGYSRYASMPDPAPAMTVDMARMRSELAKLDSYARSRGKRLVTPFATDAVAAFASQLPLERKVIGGERKIILREVAALLELPSSSRPKKAAQYSSGILKGMEREARRAGMRLADWTAQAAKDTE